MCQRDYICTTLNASTKLVIYKQNWSWQMSGFSQLYTINEISSRLFIFMWVSIIILRASERLERWLRWLQTILNVPKKILSKAKQPFLQNFPSNCFRVVKNIRIAIFPRSLTGVSKINKFSPRMQIFCEKVECFVECFVQ